MPEEIFERTAQIMRGEGDADNVISGILATNGEASDGHILNIRGGKFPKSPPLLFGHDDYTGRSNLGSWTKLTRELNGDKLGDQVLRGKAKVETSVGSGGQLEFRQDVLAMIQAEHIEQFSLRWRHDDKPTYRTDLPKDHPAYLSDKQADGAKRWGLYFDKWRMLEGSVVTIGADPEAIIGRMRSAKDSFGRRTWGRGLAEMINKGQVPGDLEPLVEDMREVLSRFQDCGVHDFDVLLRILRSDVDPSELVPVEDGEGRRLLLPEWAFQALVRQAIPWVSRTMNQLDDTSIEEESTEETVDETTSEVPEETQEAESRSDGDVKNSEPGYSPLDLAARIERLNKSSKQRTQEAVSKKLMELVRGE